MTSFKTKIGQDSQKNFLLQRINTTASLASLPHLRINESNLRTTRICFNQIVLKQRLPHKMETPVNTLQVSIMEATKVATIEAILPTMILGVSPLLNIHQGAGTLTPVETIILEVVISIECKNPFQNYIWSSLYINI